MNRPFSLSEEPSRMVSTAASPRSFATGTGYWCRVKSSSTAAPSRTTRPRRSRAATSNGRMLSSGEVRAGARTGIAIWLIVRASPGTGEDTFLGVKPVFRLVEHDGLRAVDHLVADLVAAMRRKAMHEEGIGFRACHQSSIDLIGPEQIVPALAVLVAHGHPGVGHDAVGAGYRALRIMADLDRGPGPSGPVEQRL